jgi:drug/metabolite transporter (DMT)-like permease
MTPQKRLLFIIILTALWSPSFLFIKLAIEELPPMTIVALRVLIGALGLSFLLLWKKRSLPSNPLFWTHSMVMAIMGAVVPYSLFCYAEETIESALAAILNGCSPMFTAFLAHLFLSSDRLHPQKAAGIAISLFGLLLLFAPNIANGLSGSTTGIMAATFGTFCYAMSHVYAKKHLTGQIPLIAPAAQLICSSLVLIPLSLYVETPLSLPFPSLTAIAGVLGLGILGSFFAYIIYYHLIENCGPTAISMVACFFPAGGILLGYLFLGESLSGSSLIACSLIFAGMAIVNDLVDLRLGARTN